MEPVRKGSQHLPERVLCANTVALQDDGPARANPPPINKGELNIKLFSLNFGGVSSGKVRERRSVLPHG